MFHIDEMPMMLQQIMQERSPSELEGGPNHAAFHFEEGSPK